MTATISYKEISRGLIFIVGVGFVLVGLREFVRSVRRYNGSIVAEGAIVGHEEHSDGDVFAARIQFTARNGVTHVFLSQHWDSKLPIGESVRIRYLPAQPEQAEVAKFAAWWLIPLFCLGFGIMFLLISIFVSRE